MSVSSCLFGYDTWENAVVQIVGVYLSIVQGFVDPVLF